MGVPSSVSRRWQLILCILFGVLGPVVVYGFGSGWFSGAAATWSKAVLAHLAMAVLIAFSVAGCFGKPGSYRALFLLFLALATFLPLVGPVLGLLLLVGEGKPLVPEREVREEDYLIGFPWRDREPEFVETDQLNPGSPLVQRIQTGPGTEGIRNTVMALADHAPGKSLAALERLKNARDTVARIFARGVEGRMQSAAEQKMGVLSGMGASDEDLFAAAESIYHRREEDFASPGEHRVMLEKGLEYLDLCLTQRYNVPERLHLRARYLVRFNRLREAEEIFQYLQRDGDTVEMRRSLELEILFAKGDWCELRERLNQPYSGKESVRQFWLEPNPYSHARN